MAKSLTGAIARYLGDEDLQDRIVLGSVSMDVLITLARLLLPPVPFCPGSHPSSTDMPLQAMQGNARYHLFFSRVPGFEADLETWKRAARQRPHVLYIDRPHNPTGQVLPLKDLEEISCGMLERGCWVIGDEALRGLLAPRESAVGMEHPNCIVTQVVLQGLGPGWHACRLRRDKRPRAIPDLQHAPAPFE